MPTARLLKSVTDLWPRSAHRMGHRPPFVFCRSWSRCRKVLLWRLVLSLVVNLQPPSMGVFVSGDWHLVHIYEEWAVFSFASVDVYSPRHLQRVPSSPEECC